MNTVQNTNGYQSGCDEFLSGLPKCLIRLQEKIVAYVHENRYNLFFIACAAIASSASPYQQSSIISEPYFKTFAYGVLAVTGIKSISLLLTPNRNRIGSPTQISNKLQTLLGVAMLIGSCLEPLTALYQVSFFSGVKIASIIYNKYYRI